MARYLLSAHSFVCMADKHAVFLDLRKDRYSALEPVEARALTGVVEGWSSDAIPALTCEQPARTCEELIRMLLEEQLLTDDELKGKTAAPVRLPQATSTVELLSREVPQVNLRHLRNFVAAWLLGTAMLRAIPLRITVERARRRKAGLSTSERPLDVKRAIELMIAYSILRPNFYSRENACLRDSAIAIEFLARYGVFPIWVFGVKMNPFAAHSWVQAGPIVLNDVVEHVNTFTPIMTI